VLSPLQEEVARVVGSLVEAEDFALAGGAALIVRGDVDRKTRDLDFFGLSAAAVDTLVPVAERALRDRGFRVHRLLDNPGFTRLLVEGDGDRTEVDVATDARLFPVEQGPGFRILSTEELAVDKVLALFGRAEARDFVDFMAVERRFGLERLFDLAAEKDRGFTPNMFREMLGRFDRLPRTEFPLSDEQHEELAGRVRAWRAAALELIPSPERSRDVGKGRAPDLGIDF
jgi:hypothetical protein